MKKTIRIGTRDSELALWQANTVKRKLEALGYKTELVPVKSQGDIVLDKPLYEMGITGIFTKTLDVAMINGMVDIAVHSMKDVPTLLPKGIMQTAVLERATSEDILVTETDADFEKPCTIATGSLRRQAQWLHRYPNHKVVDIRGNVNTRLQKLKDNNWEGAIFAKAGLERINVLPKKYINLDWMIPAPAQGAMVIVAMENDPFSIEATSKLNHTASDICTHIERQFLNTLEGGCTAPIGAFAEIIQEKIMFKGCLFSLDGKEMLEVEKSVNIKDLELQGVGNEGGPASGNSAQPLLGLTLGKNCAQEILQNGGKELMAKIKKRTNK
ncbi:hydroxymethylbilane synthase [Aequorivita marina]|uniref:hydroxymethylbilane synthase n=1 Tax=Aequorivita marina TaxID=3073654 RepID=UPI0028768B8E|nr:hydroxymethylbilane synthase [Aequorivita sp. S2608]MDS1297464.1 hydroxymethylbilane synthase [Aequorivita sp. S2608]